MNIELIPLVIMGFSIALVSLSIAVAFAAYTYKTFFKK